MLLKMIYYFYIYQKNFINVMFQGKLNVYDKIEMYGEYYIDFIKNQKI